jgi:hypothetical protein
MRSVHPIAACGERVGVICARLRGRRGESECDSRLG